MNHRKPLPQPPTTLLKVASRAGFTPIRLRTTSKLRKQQLRQIPFMEQNGATWRTLKEKQRGTKEERYLLLLLCLFASKERRDRHQSTQGTKTIALPISIILMVVSYNEQILYHVGDKGFEHNGTLQHTPPNWWYFNHLTDVQHRVTLTKLVVLRTPTNGGGGTRRSVRAMALSMFFES